MTPNHQTNTNKEPLGHQATKATKHNFVYLFVVVYDLVAGWPDVNPPPTQEQNTHTKDCFGQIKVWAVDRFHALVCLLGGTWPSGNPTPYTNKQNNNMNNNVFVGGWPGAW